jgi:hypothetical protein
MPYCRHPNQLNEALKNAGFEEVDLLSKYLMWAVCWAKKK